MRNETDNEVESIDFSRGVNQICNINFFWWIDFFAQDTIKKEKEEGRTVYEDFSNHEATHVWLLVSCWLECSSFHFSLWAPWNIICVCLGLDLWSARPAVHTRVVSIGYHQSGPSQHHAACSDESNQSLQLNFNCCLLWLSLLCFSAYHW